MTDSSAIYFAESYLKKIKDIGEKILAQDQNSIDHQDAKAPKVYINNSGVITLESLKGILFMVSELSKNCYYDLVKQYRSVRRKSLSDIGNYNLAIENLEKEISLRVGATANEVFAIVGAATEEIDQSLGYHLQHAQSRFEIVQGLIEMRTKHRMENGEPSEITEKTLEKVFDYLKCLTADPKNFESFFNLERPSWNIAALFETYLFDKVWEEFGLEEEDILRAISSKNVETGLMRLIGEYRQNLAKIIPEVLAQGDSNKFFAEKIKALSNVGED